MSTELISPVHTVTAPGCNSTSPRYIGPMLGNGELCLFLDENGLMHDFQEFPVWPSPRIYWAGRRLGTPERPMVPFGLVTARPSWEWMESTDWSQKMDLKRGLVVTEHTRGKAKETTETALLLDRNLIAINKRIERVLLSGHLHGVDLIFTVSVLPNLNGLRVPLW